MKIGIEARKLFSKSKHGMDLVALELIKNIASIDKNNDYIIFTQSGPDKPIIPHSDNLKIIELPSAPVPGWEQFILPVAVKQHKCDLLHCTSNTGPMKISVPLVLTLHDIIYLENNRAIKDANSVYQKLKNHYRKFVVPKIVENATQIITVSKYQENVIKTHLPASKNKITTIYNGVSEHFHISCDTEKAKSVKEKFGLPNKFILFLGSNDPKKNTIGTIAGYRLYKKDAKNDVPLVLVDTSEKKLNKYLADIKAPELREHIMLTGYVRNDELPYLYTLASVFLYPSYKESFGIPILEAMACGTPVITSNTSSMPEVAENAAYIVDPFDSLSIAKAISQILEHPMLREGLIKSGMEQIKKFSFCKMARSVIDIYKKSFD